MSRTFTELLLQARQRTGWTQEQAAERLGISVRTLAHYEAGRIPTDEKVARLANVYRAPYLGYTYLAQETETGRAVLPQLLQTEGLASGIMRIRVAMKKADQIYDRLEEIAADNTVSSEEQQEFKQCWQEIEKLVQNAVAVKFSTR